MRTTGLCLVRTKVLLAAVAQPDSELLGDFVFLRFAQLIVEGQGFLAFISAGGVTMRVPKPFGGSNPATGLFDESFAFEGARRLLSGFRHSMFVFFRVWPTF